MIPLTWKHKRSMSLLPEAIITQGAVRVVVRMKYDTDADLDYLGRFSNEWKPGAIHHQSKRELPWFIPADQERAQLLYERYSAYLKDEWAMLCLTATVFYGDVTLAEDSIHGVESDSGQPHLDLCANEVIVAALSEATEAMKRLSTDLVEFVKCANTITAQYEAT